MPKRTDSGTFESMWTPKRTKKALELYVTRKWPLRRVADFFECSLGAVQNVMNREGVMRKRVRRFTKEEETRMYKMYEIQHMPIDKIASVFGTTDKVINNVVKTKGWKRDPEASRRKAQRKQQAATISKYLSTEKRSYADYLSAARRLVWPIWGKWHRHIDPEAKRLTKNYSVDHRLSIWEGYHKFDNLDLRIVAHPVNLRTISQVRNAHKGKRSSVSLKKLRKQIRAFEAQHGKVFK